MALAFLCSRLQCRQPDPITSDPRYKFHAFVVDHKLRPESGTEAKIVLEYLEKLGSCLRCGHEVSAGLTEWPLRTRG